ncbi:hypothetical protein AV530_017332 [Patagioenas fasciata monilis]|uniref:Uncharacterized protein n=1 Tax=Patagioenas fasciata monilis TaxID=372326 RepID=A0A1V4JFP0_PATFA|nr:hypothetical protein AV530_017332 [Patagioenas fasciata monilis]
MSYSVQLSSLDRKLCKRDRRETEVFREETVELEQEQEMTAAWLLSKDAFRHLVFKGVTIHTLRNITGE